MKSLVVGSALIASLICSGPVRAAVDCTVVDLMPAFWKSLAADDATTRMRTDVIDRYPDLYNDKYVDLPNDATWPDELARDKVYVEAHRAEVDAAEQFLVSNVPRYMREFRKTFPDYRCDFTFYIAPSFGHMDGSAATVNGQHRIIFAPDVIPRLHKLADLKVLIDHETFHIYHNQSTGELGASEEAVPTIEAALWSEGLASFPSITLDTALLQPAIPEGTKPYLGIVATELLAHLQEKNESQLARFFMGGKPRDVFPRRAGYYVGFLIAENLSKRHSMTALAHLKGSALHDAIVSELESLKTVDTTDVTDGSRKAPPSR
jgi:hypothetical protein